MKDIGYMMDIILRYIQDTGFYMLLVMPIILIVRYLHIKRFKVQTSFLHELGLVIFFMILTGLLSQTILPTIYSSQGEVKFINGDHRAINLELFRVFGETYNAIKFLDLWQPLLINFVGNIVMFMPIGFFLPLLWGKFNRAWRSVGMGFLVSLVIEVVQLTQMRSSDVDDLLLNTFGTSIGYVLYKALSKTFRDSFKIR